MHVIFRMQEVIKKKRRNVRQLSTRTLPGPAPDVHFNSYNIEWLHKWFIRLTGASLNVHVTVVPRPVIAHLLVWILAILLACLL
jgi:hypothetical protein